MGHTTTGGRGSPSRPGLDYRKDGYPYVPSHRGQEHLQNLQPRGKRGPGPGRGFPDGGPGGICGHHRPVRLGEIHPDEYAGLPGRLHLGPVPHRRPGRFQPQRRRVLRNPQQRDRLHLPGLQPHPQPQRPRKCGAAPDLPWNGPGGAPPLSGWGWRSGWTTAPPRCPAASSSG